jgi:Ca2+-binding RTX toxin-like protein
VELRGDGTDTVLLRHSSFSLNGRNLEHMRGDAAMAFSMTGDDRTANRLTGGTMNDTIMGLGGADTLDGGIGADSMMGGVGDDLYIVDHANDVVWEDARKGIADTVLLRYHTFNAGNSEIENITGDANMAFHITGHNGVANRLTGAGLADTLIGLGGADTLRGLDGDDSLVGGSGNDRLVGGLGNDVMSGGAGQDRFVFDSTLGADNVDVIQDFNVIDDTILLDGAVFEELVTPGVLSAEAFVISRTGAFDGNDRIIYNDSTGALYYDADGSGSGAAIQFATLTIVGTLTTLTHADFQII